MKNKENQRAHIFLGQKGEDIEKLRKSMLNLEWDLSQIENKRVRKLRTRQLEALRKRYTDLKLCS